MIKPLVTAQIDGTELIILSVTFLATGPPYVFGDYPYSLFDLPDFHISTAMLKAEDLEWLGDLAVVLRIQPQEKTSSISSAQEWRQVIAEALYRLDIIPAGLVLARGASESGWDASH